MASVRGIEGPVSANMNMAKNVSPRKPLSATVLSLAEAAHAAVDASNEEIPKIVARVGQLTDLLRDSATDVRRACLGEEDGSAARFSHQLDETVTNLWVLFDRHIESLKRL